MENDENLNFLTETQVNEDVETNIIQEDTPVTLETIHTDLGIICTFLSLASIVVFSVIIYKLFRIFF